MNLDPIRKLIKDATRWKAEHKVAGRHIEAAAAAIRIQALEDALAAMEKQNG